MSKELHLEKAFNAAMANGVVNGVDEQTRVAVIKESMMAYAKKNNLTVTSNEVESYITENLEKIEAALADFKFSNKIMN